VTIFFSFNKEKIRCFSIVHELKLVVHAFLVVNVFNSPLLASAPKSCQSPVKTFDHAGEADAQTKTQKTSNLSKKKTSKKKVLIRKPFFQKETFFKVQQRLVLRDLLLISNVVL